MTSILFNSCNTALVLAWAALIFLPKQKISKILISYPWVPLGLSFFYLYFISISGGLLEADFSSLDGIVSLFKKATPESAAAGWLHYLAFDFWVGTWIVKHSRKVGIPHWQIIVPMLLTFLLGPVGILAYSLLLLVKNRFKRANENKYPA